MSKSAEWRCKSCDSILDISRAKDGVVECAFCHNVYPVPKHDADPEVISFLRMGEHELDTAKFDDAYDAFSKAAQLDPKEPQAHFGKALAEFKVQQLKDCRNNSLQPICHYISQKQFEDNKNYLKAVSLATQKQKNIYTKQAKAITEIGSQFASLKARGIKYDCFICFKATDTENGAKTKDYHAAYDLYHDLKEKGYNPFFSEVDCLNAVGSDYEARILYGLYSAECMLVVCSKEEYLQTPWVKNEYTRFLKLIGDERKDSDSVAIVFNGTPIEYLPGKAGKIQGINLARPNAYTLIEKYVYNHTPKARAEREEAAKTKQRESEELRRQLEEQKRAQAEIEARLKSLNSGISGDTKLNELNRRISSENKKLSELEERRDELTDDQNREILQNAIIKKYKTAMSGARCNFFGLVIMIASFIFGLSNTLYDMPFVLLAGLLGGALLTLIGLVLMIKGDGFPGGAVKLVAIVLILFWNSYGFFKMFKIFFTVPKKKRLAKKELKNDMQKNREELESVEKKIRDTKRKIEQYEAEVGSML